MRALESALVDISKTMGSRVSDGMPNAIGFVLSTRLTPPCACTRGPPEVQTIPTQPVRAMRSA